MRTLTRPSSSAASLVSTPLYSSRSSSGRGELQGERWEWRRQSVQGKGRTRSVASTPRIGGKTRSVTSTPRIAGRTRSVTSTPSIGGRTRTVPSTHRVGGSARSLANTPSTGGRRYKRL